MNLHSLRAVALASSLGLSSFFGMCDCDDGASPTKEESNTNTETIDVSNAPGEPPTIVIIGNDPSAEVKVTEIDGWRVIYTTDVEIEFILEPGNR